MCTGCASELTTGELCGVCLKAGWEQRSCGCIYDPREEQVTECDNCDQNRAEAAYERMVEDYYGGSGPQTIHEQSELAWVLKRSFR